MDMTMIDRSFSLLVPVYGCFCGDFLVGLVSL